MPFGDQNPTDYRQFIWKWTCVHEVHLFKIIIPFQSEALEQHLKDILKHNKKMIKFR